MFLYHLAGYTRYIYFLNDCCRWFYTDGCVLSIQIIVNGNHVNVIHPIRTMVYRPSFVWQGFISVIYSDHEVMKYTYRTVCSQFSHFPSDSTYRTVCSQFSHFPSDLVLCYMYRHHQIVKDGPIVIAWLWLRRWILYVVRFRTFLHNYYLIHAIHPTISFFCVIHVGTIREQVINQGCR